MKRKSTVTGQYLARRPSNIMKVLDFHEASKDSRVRKSITVSRKNIEMQEVHHQKDPQFDPDLLIGDKGSPNEAPDENEEFVVNFEESNMNQLVHHDRDSGNFANMWSQLLLLAHAYNFITAWYFLGLEGFPSGTWLAFEILAEIILASDILVMLCLKNRMPN